MVRKAVAKKAPASKVTATKATSTKAPPAKAQKPKTRSTQTTAAAEQKSSPKLLSGGNPQIAKGDGDGPIQEYIAAMPGWKQDVGRRLDSLIEQAVPNVKKAVKWNSPFYGIEGQTFFLGFHCLTKYIKIAFFDGAKLLPLPPVESKSDDVRYLHVYENGEFDEKQFIDWVKQSTKLPGWGKA